MKKAIAEGSCCPTLSSSNITLRPLTEQNHALLSDLCQECTDFFELIEGQAGGANTANDLLGPPPQNAARGTNYIFGIYLQEKLIGVSELLANFPESFEWYVGLLLLLPQHRNHRLGATTWNLLSTWLIDQNAILVRAVVQKQNPAARRFWEEHGFILEQEIVGTFGKLESPAWRMSYKLNVTR